MAINQILDKIKQSHITVCLISQKKRNSGWVNWELEQSRLLGKPIVEIVLKYQPVRTLAGAPEFFTRYSQYAVHEWNLPQELNRVIHLAHVGRNIR